MVFLRVASAICPRHHIKSWFPSPRDPAQDRTGGFFPTLLCLITHVLLFGSAQPTPQLSSGDYLAATPLWSTQPLKPCGML